MKRWIIALCFALFMPLCSLAEVWTEDQFTSDGQFSMRYPHIRSHFVWT